jgi:glycosyl transferase family 87
LKNVTLLAPCRDACGISIATRSGVQSRRAARVFIAVTIGGALGFAGALLRTISSPSAIVATDFSVFWSGWWLILHGRGSSLYDAASQMAAQRLVMHGSSFQGGLMAFLHPPHAALAGVPFGWMADHAGERIAFFVWTAGSLALLIVLDRWLREACGVGKGPHRWMITFGLLAFYPMFETLRLGQVSILLAVAALGVYRSSEAQRPLAGAAWLLVLTIKPQLMPAILVFLIARRQWRMLAYAGALIAASVAITAAILGPAIWIDYARNVNHLEQFFGTGTPDHMINVRGLLSRFVPSLGQATIDRTAYVLWIVAPLGVMWRPSYAFAVAIALITSPHLFLQDTVIWTVVVGLITGPQSWRRELHRAPVGIAEVHARAAALPGDAAFDRDAELGEPRFPRGEIRRIDRERHVAGTAGIVSRHDAARQLHRL